MAAGTVVIGGGVAGLGVAAQLAERGLPFAVLDAEQTIGASWQGRYDSLRLHTARALSGLPGRALPRHGGRWVSRDDFVVYLQAYAAQFGIEPEHGVEVTGLRRTDGAWQLETSAGPRTAESVVIATGPTRRPVVPDWPGLATFDGTLLHSSAYRSPLPYAGQDVLVVGSGNSATEIAVDLLSSAATVALAVRTPPNLVRRTTLGLPSQVIGIATSGLPDQVMDPVSALVRRLSVPDLTAYGLPAPRQAYTQFRRTLTTPVLDHGFVDAVLDRRITVVPPVSAFVGDEVRFADQTIRYPHTVIAATGYDPDLGGLLGDLALLDEHGFPRIQGARTDPRAPGLYAVGLRPVLTGHVYEVSRLAPAIADAIARTATSTT